MTIIIHKTIKECFPMNNASIYMYLVHHHKSLLVAVVEEGCN